MKTLNSNNVIQLLVPLEFSLLALLLLVIVVAVILVAVVVLW